MLIRGEYSSGKAEKSTESKQKKKITSVLSQFDSVFVWVASKSQWHVDITVQKQT